AEKKNLPADNGTQKSEGVGRNLFDSFGVLGLGLDATEMDVKTAYRMLALQNHPDPDKNTRTALNELAWMDGFSRHATGVL
ncbi:hypothetical protein THAOC_29672, partial [Thalassiosira oceanica]